MSQQLHEGLVAPPEFQLTDNGNLLPDINQGSITDHKNGASADLDIYGELARIITLAGQEATRTDQLPRSPIALAAEIYRDDPSVKAKIDLLMLPPKPGSIYTVELPGQTKQRLPRLNSDQEKALTEVIKEGAAAFKAVAQQANLNQQQLEGLLATVKDGVFAYEVFVVSNLDLALSITKKFYRKPGGPAELEEICKEAIAGLHKAVQQFDPASGMKFATYADWSIESTVYNMLASKSEKLNVSGSAHKAYRKIMKTKKELSKETTGEPSHEVLAVYAGLTVAQVTELILIGESAKSSRLTDSELIKLLETSGLLSERERLIMSLHYDVYLPSLAGVIIGENGKALTYHELFYKQEVREAAQPAKEVIRHTPEVAPPVKPPPRPKRLPKMAEVVRIEIPVPSAAEVKVEPKPVLAEAAEPPEKSIKAEAQEPAAEEPEKPAEPILAAVAEEPEAPELPKQPEAAEIQELTDTETEVLSLIAAGYSVKEVGETLEIGGNTVRKHCKAACDKLGVQELPHAIRRLFELGTFEPEEEYSGSISLSLLEATVLDLISRGKGLPEICEILSLPGRTVLSIEKKIFKALDVTNSAEAVYIAYTIRLLPLEVIAPEAAA